MPYFERDFLPDYKQEYKVTIMERTTLITLQQNI